MSKDEEIRNLNIRRKNLLYLMQRYLHDSGFHNTVEALTKEARLDDEWELCDNIDLDGIYLEYASYYQLKFGKYPRILRKAKPTVKLEVGAAKRKKTKPPNSGKENGNASTPNNVTTVAEGELQVLVKRIDTTDANGGGGGGNSGGVGGDGRALEQLNDQLMKLHEVEHGGNSASGSGGDALLNCQEWQSLAAVVRATIMNDDLRLNWQDMYGNVQAVALVKEAVLAPLKYPQLFANGLKPWRSLLVHGPPGSGKTQLAKILYAETRGQVTFFNISSSVIISKWRGESEKMLRILFSLARHHAPSIIFFDEIEGLTSKRDRPSDHESSKRFKNELLQLLDGMERGTEAATTTNSFVFVLASTNLPWDIDEAFLRRFEKKLLVQLPNATERARLIGKLLPLTVPLTNEQMENLVRLSEHFTGDEIRLACKEIAMQTVRRAAATTAAAGGSSSIGGGAGGIGKIKTTADSPLTQAFEQIKPLSVKLMAKHLQWQQEHGS